MTTLSTLHVDLVFLAANLSCKCLAELGLRHFPLPFPENKTAGSPLPSPLSFIFLWRLGQSPVHRGQLIIPSPVSPVSQTLRGYRHSTHRWKNHQFQLTPSPVHFAQTPWRSAEFTPVSSSTLYVSAHSLPDARALQYRRGYEAFSRLWCAAEVQRCRSLAVVTAHQPCHVVDSEVSVGQSGNLFSSASSLARCLGEC